MHICLFSIRNIQGWALHRGGVQTHANNLITFLLKQGYYVSLITSNGHPEKTDRLKIIPVNVGTAETENRLWFERTKDAFIRLDKDHPVDLIFSEGGGARGLVTRRNGMNIPVIAFVHNTYIHYFYNNWQEVDGLRSFKSYLFRSVPSYIFGIFWKDIPFFTKCQKIVAGSSAIAGHLKRYYQIRSEKIETIHNWVDTQLFSFDSTGRAALRNKFGIEENAIAFLLVGSLWRPKGFRIALRAFERLIKDIPNVVLLVAGNGPDKSYFEKYIRKSELLGSHVKMLGLYSQKSLPSLYSSADVFILPSLLNEVLPYTLIEAMSCSLPVIATDISASREAMGSSGCIIPRGDVDALSKAMREFSVNLHQKKEEAKNNRKRVQKFFSFEAASIKLNNLIRNFINSDYYEW